jgi:polyferredoxin
MKLQKIRKFILLISFILFPVTLYYLSPYLILAGGFNGVAVGSFFVFAAQFILSLLFGRAFCGWVCPAGALQECCTQVVDKRVNIKRASWIKYVIWAPWLITIVIAFIRAGGIKDIDVLFMTDHGISASGIPGYIMYLSIVFLILILALLTGKRGMCHTICWMAPFMVIGTAIKDRLKYPSLHLKAEPDKCVKCGLCTRSCPMSLDVEKMVSTGQTHHNECILCGACASGCKKEAVKLSFGKNK